MPDRFRRRCGHMSHISPGAAAAADAEKAGVETPLHPEFQTVHENDDDVSIPNPGAQLLGCPVDAPHLKRSSFLACECTHVFERGEYSSSP